MKKFIYICIGTTLFLSACIGNKPIQKTDLVLVKNNHALCTIVIPENPNIKLIFPEGETYRYAAEFLQKCFFEVTGVRPEIKTDGSNIDNVPIYIGDCIEVKDTLEEYPDLRQTDEQGYSIFPCNNGIAITGTISKRTDTGILFGIYAFVEKVIGIRWYFPIPEEIGKVVKKSKTISFKQYIEKSAPFYKMRMGLLSGRIDAKIKHPYLWTGSTVGPMPNHTQEPWKRLYGKKHPEYFGVNADGSSSLNNESARTGQSRCFLCYNNPAVLKQMIKNIEVFDRNGNKHPWGGREPTGNFVQFAPDDTWKRCQCKQCKPQLGNFKTDRFGSSSEYIFAFAAKYAEEIKKRWPNRRLRILAYQDYEKPPENVKFPDNVDVMICLMQPINVQQKASAFKRQSEIIEGWYNLLGKDKNRVFVWDYMCWPNCWLNVPVYYPETLKKWHEANKNKVSGIFNNGLSHGKYFRAQKKGNDMSPEKWFRLHMTTFMVWYYARFMWNPNLDYKASVKRFCDDMFGPASTKMQKFFITIAILWDHAEWKKDYKGMWRLLPHNHDLRKQYKKTQIAELQNLLNEAIKMVPKDSDEYKRLQWFKEQAFGPFFMFIKKNQPRKK